MAAGSAPERWETTPMRRRTRSGRRRTSSPATLAVPESGRASVVRILMVVDLPAPLGPSSPKISPFGDGDRQPVERPYARRVGLDEVVCLDGGRDRSVW